MTRTLQSETGEPSSTRERVHHHVFDAGPPPVPPADLAHGTPWPHGSPCDISEPYEFVEGEDTLDADLTEPVPLESPWLEMEVEPLRVIELEADDIGTRTLMGVGARAVRAVATAGWVEGRAARRGLAATPDVPFPQAPPSGTDSSAPPRVIVSPHLWDEPSSRGVPAQVSSPSVQPPHLPEQLPYPVMSRAALDAVGSAPVALPAAALAPGFEPWWPQAQARAVAEPGPASPIYRVLALAALALALVALGAYLGMTL